MPVAGFFLFESPGNETNNHLPVWLNSQFGAGVAGDFYLSYRDG